MTPGRPTIHLMPDTREAVPWHFYLFIDTNTKATKRTVTTSFSPASG